MRPAVAAVLVLPLVFACDGGLKPEYASTYCPTGICGTIHFRGAVPDSTDWVRVVVYAAIPESASQLTSFAGFSDVLPLGVDSARYSCCLLPLAAGSYAWVITVWKKKSDSALTVTTAADQLREMGAFPNPADTTEFGTVVVPGGGGTGGVDMVADYGKMRSISDFFPTAPPARARRPAGRR